MKKITLRDVIFGLLVLGVLVIMGLNIFVLKNQNFWETSITQCLTLLVALVISYLFSQKRLDERRQKDAYLKLLEKVQQLVSDKALYEINTAADINLTLMKKRELNNCFTILEKYASKFSLDEDIKFMVEKKQEYVDFFGNHSGDIEYLSKSSNDLLRPLTLIESRVMEIMIKLFD